MHMQGPLGPRVGKDGKRLCFTIDMKMTLQGRQQMDDLAPNSALRGQWQRELSKGTRNVRRNTDLQQHKWRKPAFLSPLPLAFERAPYPSSPFTDPRCSNMVGWGQEGQDDQNLISVHSISTFQ